MDIEPLADQRGVKTTRQRSQDAQRKKGVSLHANKYTICDHDDSARRFLLLSAAAAADDDDEFQIF